MYSRRRAKVVHPSRQGDGEGSASERGLWATVHRFLSKEVWLPDLAGVGFLRALALKIARIAYLTVRGFVHDNCLFRASGLTYITVLSLVPLLAFSFSIAKGFGGYEALRDEIIVPFLDQVLPESEIQGPAVATPEPPGAEPEASSTDLRGVVAIVLETVENTDFAKLGFFGLAILLYTVIKLIGAIEGALNDIWGVPRSRSVVRKLSDYLTMVVVTPIFLFVGLGLFTLSRTELLDTLREDWGLDAAINQFVAASPFFVIWTGLSLLYLAIPNTRVRWSSAFLGGFFGAALTISALIAHNEFQIGVANANKIYAGFAALPIFLFFIYLLWTALLLGAELAAAHQSEPAFRHLALAEPTDQAARERIALRAVVRIGQAFSAGTAPVAAMSLARELGLPPRTLAEVLDPLEDRRLLAATEDEHGERSWLPARRLESIHVADVLAALREPAQKDAVALDAIDQRIEEKLAGLAASGRESRHNVSLEELVGEAPGTDSDDAAAGRPAVTDGSGASGAGPLPEPAG